MALWQDVRYAVRLLLKDRWFTAVAAVALALGIGANAAVFTFVNAVLLRGLPFDDPDRIVSIGSLDARGRNLGVSRLDFIDIREAARSYSGLTMFMGAGVNVADVERLLEKAASRGPELGELEDQLLERHRIQQL